MVQKGRARKCRGVFEPWAQLISCGQGEIPLVVEAHNADSGFEDFIEGKGHGLVINLFGPPGLGDRAPLSVRYDDHAYASACH